MNPKKLAAEKAVEYIRPGMTVGLGTGTTAFFAIEKIGEMVRQGLEIHAVASSLASTAQARKNGIPMVGMTEISHIDVTIDGADEVDERGNLIKGGGGALTREKILAYNSTQFIIIVDASKLSGKLQRFPVAVEVVPFGYNLALAHLQQLGCRANIRQQGEGFFKTDNGNWIVDCGFGMIEDPEYLNAAINLIPGVVESGLFSSKMVHTIIVGYPDGQVSVKQAGA
ncbi:MAG: ribose-5-phosphate isomerase RpiA [Flavisolibacter sp.]